MKPNISLLKDAYAIIDGIPADRINLTCWVLKLTPSLCNTVACAGGWLALHPAFKARGLKLATDSGIKYIRYGNQDGMRALAKLFNISTNDAISLFKVRTDAYRHLFNDKQLFLQRLNNFIEYHEHHSTS